VPRTRSIHLFLEEQTIGSERIILGLQRLFAMFATVHIRTYSLEISHSSALRYRRTIPLTPLAVDSLRRHRTRQLEERLAAGQADWNADQLVFCTTVGTSYSQTNWRKQQYMPMLKKAGLPYIRPHDLRRTAATLLLLEGVQPLVVSEMLGHASVAMASRRATQPANVCSNVPRRTACPSCHAAASSVAFAISTPTVSMAYSSGILWHPSTTDALLVCGPLTTSYAGSSWSDDRRALDSLRRADLSRTVLRPGSPGHGASADVLAVSGAHCTTRTGSRGII
jgi:hypothetical protein